MTGVDVAGRLSVVTQSNQLQQVLQAALDARGWTVAELARRSGVPDSTVRAWTRPRGRRSRPDAEKLRLAEAALGIAEGTLVQAAQSAAGYEVVEITTDDPDFQVFVAQYEDLTEEAKARLLRHVRLLMNDPDLFPTKRDEAPPGG